MQLYLRRLTPEQQQVLTIVGGVAVLTVTPPFVFGMTHADVPHNHYEDTMSGQGSAGNVIAALCSFFIPGLGQLIQGRVLKAIFQFVLAAALWFVWLGWVIHLWSVVDAALWKPKS